MTIRNIFNRESGVKGSGSKSVVTTHEINALATDAAGDVLFIAPVSGDLIPISATAYTDGITGATSVSLGFYKGDVSGEVAYDADALASAVNIATAGNEDMLAALTPTTRMQTVRELSGATNADTEFVLALTLVSEVTANGTVKIIMEWAQA